MFLQIRGFFFKISGQVYEQHVEVAEIAETEQLPPRSAVVDVVPPTHTHTQAHATQAHTLSSRCVSTVCKISSFNIKKKKVKIVK